MGLWRRRRIRSAWIDSLARKHLHRSHIRTQIACQRKAGPRPSNVPGYGRTGRSLAEQIEKLLFESLKAKECCDLILVIDDLDCHDRDARRELFDKSIGKVDQAANIEHYIGFASPEVEAWIVADWDHSVAKDPDYRGCHNQMRNWLSTQKAVPFDRPETFSSYDREKDSCRDKLSDAIIESSIYCGAQARYSKGGHTARFLRRISPEVVSGKCPLFRALHHRLSQTE